MKNRGEEEGRGKVRHRMLNEISCRRQNNILKGWQDIYIRPLDDVMRTGREKKTSSSWSCEGGVGRVG